MPAFWIAMVVEAPSSPTSMWLDYAKTLLVLAGICLVALVVAKVLLPRLTGFVAPASYPIHILATYPLEPRKTLYLVRTGKTVILLASSSEAVHFMATLNPEDFQDIVAPAQTNLTSGSGFRRIAQAIADRKQGRSL